MAISIPAVQPERLFFSGASLAMVAVIGYGFAPSFYLKHLIAPRHPTEALVTLVVLHGLLFTAWLLLFVAQAALVAAGRLDLHRRAGLLGFAMLPALVIVGVATALNGVTRPLTAPPGIGALSWLAMPLLDIPVFATLIGLGLANRSRPAAHKRYLYIAMADMMGPGFGRMTLPVPPALHGPVATILLPALFLLALIGWDLRSRGRVLTVTLGGSIAVLGMAILKPAIWYSPAWLAFAGWITAPFR